MPYPCQPAHCKGRPARSQCTHAHWGRPNSCLQWTAGCTCCTVCPNCPPNASSRRKVSKDGTPHREPISPQPQLHRNKPIWTTWAQPRPRGQGRGLGTLRQHPGKTLLQPARPPACVVVFLSVCLSVCQAMRQRAPARRCNITKLGLGKGFQGLGLRSYAFSSLPSRLLGIHDRRDRERDMISHSALRSSVPVVIGMFPAWSSVRQSARQSGLLKRSHIGWPWAVDTSGLRPWTWDGSTTTAA